MSDLDPGSEPRSATASVTPGSADTNVLRGYVAVLRRRWVWVALGLLVGLVGGAASTVLIKEEHDPNNYYRATNTQVVVVRNASGDTSISSTASSGATSNLQQAAFLIHSADVVDTVAQKTGISSTDVNNLVSAVARSDVNAIDVTAISTDPNQATLLANTAASTLTDYVTKNEQTQYTNQVADLNKKITDIRAQNAGLAAQIGAQPTPTNVADLNAQLEANVATLSATLQQLATLQAIGGPGAGFTALQKATPVQINVAGYLNRLNANMNALGSAASTSPTTVAGDTTETDLSVGPPVSKRTRILIGAVAGLVMGLAMAFLVEAWDDRLRRRERVEALTGLPVIAEVPRYERNKSSSLDIAVVDMPQSRPAERYRSVRTAVLFSMHERLHTDSDDHVTIDGSAPVIMVTSPNPSEGKSTTVANLAAAFGSNGMRTLVIDCDYRKPAIAAYLNPIPDFDDPKRPSSTRLPNVTFVPAPRGANRDEVVQLLRETIATWRDSVDMVILDTPPMLTTNDATDLLAAADAVLLVLRAGQTRSGPAERVANVLARYRAEVLGIVLNSCDNTEMDSYYGYYQGYGEEPAPTGRAGSRVAAVRSSASRGGRDAARAAAERPAAERPAAEQPADETNGSNGSTRTNGTTGATGTAVSGAARSSTGAGAADDPAVSPTDP
jgi:Mrp family chromosome partitioning ATPase/capsular polysaccharide biosynthesis protein